MRTDIRVTRGGAEIIDDLADEWRTFCTDAVNNQPFYRPEWIAAYIRAFNPKANLWLIAARNQSQLCAILPLVLEHTTFRGLPVRKLRGAANVHSLRFDLLCRSGLGGDIALEDMWHHISQMRSWDMIEMPYVPGDGAFARLTDLASREGYPTGKSYLWRTPYITMDPQNPEPEWQRTLHADHRRQLRRTREKIETLGKLRLDRITECSKQSLDEFYQLEKKGWKGKSGSAIASNSQTLQFYEEFAKSSSKYGYFVLHSLRLNQTCIAAVIGMSYLSRFSPIKSAYDEQYSKFGIGHILIEEILKDCKASGVTEFEFMGPWAPYKAKWAQLVKPHFYFYIFRKGYYGTLLRLLKFSVTPVLKKLAGKDRDSLQQ